MIIIIMIIIIMIIIIIIIIIITMKYIDMSSENYILLDFTKYQVFQKRKGTAKLSMFSSYFRKKRARSKSVSECIFGK